MFTWLTDWIGNVLITKYVGNAIKTAIAALAMLLTQKGIVSAEDAANLTDAIIAIIPSIIAWLLKVWASYATRKVALLTPASKAASVL